jgi:hypothetical protein
MARRTASTVTWVRSFAAGDALTFDSSLEVDVSDLFLTYTMELGCGWLEFAAGARHARIEQEYHHRDASFDGALIIVTDSSSRFEGTGPAVSFAGRLPMTQRLAFLGVFRQSFLIGTAEQQATQIANDVLVARRFQGNDDFRPITELELGLDYCLEIGCRCDLFVQVAFVAQLWQGAGNSSNSDINTLQFGTGASDKNADLLMHGVHLAGGLRF